MDMLGFPKSTEFNKRIPKQKFYEHIEVSPASRRVFVEQIRMIYWRNKLAESTLNLAPGEAVSEVEVIEIRLQEPQLDEAVLRQIDKEIPYHILFILTCDGKAQAWIGYKEATSGSNTFKVSRYFHTEWIQESDLHFTIDGLNILAYGMIPIAGDALTARSGESLKDAITREEKRKLLERQIAVLESRIKKETQPKKKFELVQQLRDLQTEEA